MPKAKKKRVEQPEQPEAEEDEGSIEEEDAGSELERGAINIQYSILLSILSLRGPLPRP